MGIADANSARAAATNNTKNVTSGQPIPITTGPPAVRPTPYKVTAPVRIEIIEKEMAKLLPSWTKFEHREVSEEEAKEQFKNNAEANKLLSRPQRYPYGTSYIQQKNKTGHNMA